MEKCNLCGRPVVAHTSKNCPPLGTHVVIDVDTLDRLDRTGHPRLLKNLLTGAANVLVGVEIEALRVVTE